jgi:hypothetical protein
LSIFTDTNGEFSFDGNEIGLGMVTQSRVLDGTRNINFHIDNAIYQIGEDNSRVWKLEF